jgi:hypothetical protein
MSPEARQILDEMGQGMRLIVPIGDLNIRLIKDPRWAVTLQEREVAKQPVIELIRAGVISQLPKDTDPEILSGKRSGKIGWLEMFKNGEVPEGAHVYALTQ